MNWRSKGRAVQARLKRDISGIGMTEFALVVPFFLTFGLWGIELANYQFQTMKIEQLSANVADNASRIGDYSTLQNRKIYESDIDDLLVGANLAAGTSMDLFNKGRIIISSLQVNASGKQYIDWQRCVGTKAVTSSYGKQGDVLGNAGIGPTGREVAATTNDAVIFVELQYEYQPLVTSSFVGDSTIKSIASYTVRSSRDLTKIYQTSPASPSMTCGKFTNSVA